MLAGAHKVGAATGLALLRQPVSVSTGKCDARAWCKEGVLSEKEESKNTAIQKLYHLPWGLQLLGQPEVFPGERGRN